MSHRCLADISGPFFNPDKPFRNWSAFPFYQTDLPIAPYVDREQLAWGLARAKQHLADLHAQGYTGIVIDNLAHLVTFEQAPALLYSPDDPHRRRAAIYRAAFNELFETAAQYGMEVYVTADMQWCTPPIRQYVGRLTAGNPRLAAVNRWALDELFATMPQVRGLVVRVGETGGAHDQSDYSGHMIYTTVESLHLLIANLLPICERHNRLLVVRSWSIGIGELGDLIWSPERYRATFGAYRSHHLLVSVKHGPADFFRLLPHNPTLGLPGPAQIIELQNRREYELFGMVPSSIARLHRSVLQHAQATNRRFAGIWAWNSTGGWGGGRAVLAEDGWSIWTELSSALTAALMGDPNLDTETLVRAWCRGKFTSEQATTLIASHSSFADAVADVYCESGALIEQGWYMGDLARGNATLGAIYLAPLLWVWWMRPTASLLIWAYLADAVDNPAVTLRNSLAACQRLSFHATRLAEMAPAGCPRASAIVESVRYFHDTVVVAHVIRSVMLQALGAAWSGKRAVWDARAADITTARETLRRYRAAWAARADLPPLELDEIDGFLAACERTPTLVWLRARAACRLVSHLRARYRRERRLHLAGVAAAALLLLSLVARRRRFGLAGILAPLLLALPFRQRLLRALLPRVSRKFNLLPSIFFETGPSFTEWTA